MKIDIITVGNIKEKYFIEAIKEYSKRIRPYSEINILEINEYRLPNNPSKAQINEGLSKEAEDILSKISDRAYVISLCIEGKTINSENLAKKIIDITLDGFSDIVFIIGGSYGLDDAVKNRSNFKLSFSKMTFPHQLMRVILLEQIYRAFKINRNEPYHK